MSDVQRRAEADAHRQAEELADLSTRFAPAVNEVLRLRNAKLKAEQEVEKAKSHDLDFLHDTSLSEGQRSARALAYYQGADVDTERRRELAEHNRAEAEAHSRRAAALAAQHGDIA